MSTPDGQEISFRTVVVGVDGRQGGRDATALAAALVEPGGRLILAAVVRPRGTERLGALFADADRRRAAQMLEAERARLGVPVSTVVSVRSSISDGLHSVVARYDADLLVVGSAHRGTVGRVLLGDDARRALNGARCAVAVAPRAADPPVWRTIAVGDDGSAESALALAAARSLAARSGAIIRDCAVVGPASLTYRELSRMDSSEAVAMRVVREQKRLAEYAGVETDVLQGDAGEVFTELGREADLIVIGSRGLGPWGRLATGSTAEYLVRHAPCPVLVLPRSVRAPTALAPDESSSGPRERVVATPRRLGRSR